MKEYILLNSADGMIVSEVDAKSCKFLPSAFIHKNGYYCLTDRATGLSIVRCKKMKDLESRFNQIREYYESYAKTDAYKIKVERFEKLKLVYNYGKEHKWNTHYKLN